MRVRVRVMRGAWRAIYDYSIMLFAPGTKSFASKGNFVNDDAARIRKVSFAVCSAPPTGFVIACLEHLMRHDLQNNQKRGIECKST